MTSPAWRPAKTAGPRLSSVTIWLPTGSPLSDASSGLRSVVVAPSEETTTWPVCRICWTSSCTSATLRPKPLVSVEACHCTATPTTWLPPWSIGLSRHEHGHGSGPGNDVDVGDDVPVGGREVAGAPGQARLLLGHHAHDCGSGLRRGLDDGRVFRDRDTRPQVDLLGVSPRLELEHGQRHAGGDQGGHEQARGHEQEWSHQLSLGSALPARCLAAARLSWVPGHDQLAIRLEADRAVEANGGLVVWARPHVPERDMALVEEPDRFPHEHLTDAASAVLGRHVHLGDLTFKPGPGVVEHDPAEADDLPDLIPHGEDHVLAPEGRGHLRHAAFDLAAGQLRVVGIVHLLAEVELDEQGLDEVVIPGRKAFHVECPHRLRC